MNRQSLMCIGAAAIWSVSCMTAAQAAASKAAFAKTATTVCIALPKAQLGQGNNSAIDVSEPVRTTLGTYMAGPSVQLVRLDARIPLQIEAEAAEKSCDYVMQSSVAQKKGGMGGGFLKMLAPLASVMPMMGGMSGSMGAAGAAMAVQAVASTAASAAAQSAQQEAMSAMTGAQQSNVKRGDTITVEYSLSKKGNATAAKKQTLQSKAKEDGEDLLGPLLEQVATEVVNIVAGK